MRLSKKEFCLKFNLTEDQFFGRTPIEGHLNLYSLITIPKGFNPTVGGSLNLGSITSIPEGFNPTVWGYLDLGSITSIPEGFNPTVGRSLYLHSLKSIPEGFNPAVGGSLNLGSITSIPEGFNPTVGDYLDLESLKYLPENYLIEAKEVWCKIIIPTTKGSSKFYFGEWSPKRSFKDYSYIKENPLKFLGSEDPLEKALAEYFLKNP